MHRVLLPSAVRIVARIVMRIVTLWLGGSLLPTALAQEPPRTVPEQSNHQRTSRPEDTAAFLQACQRLPHGNRVHVEVAGTSEQGRDLLLVQLRLPDAAPTPLRALVIGDIHAGEVEGKEALQQLVREVALGLHTELLAQCALWLLPIYNPDGDAAQGPHRPGQNGPDLVGKRENGAGLDLNRDFLKVEAASTRTLLRLVGEVDPHLFVDLHTTNGSYHGYQLTFAPSLSPNVDPTIARLSRALLDDARTSMREDHGYETFDYGNFETRDWDGGRALESPRGQRGWYSYDHRARYLVNGFALRNRIGVLSEAYSYCDFATRIAATHAFVLSLWRRLVERRAEVLRTTAAADEALVQGAPTTFGFQTRFAPPEMLPVLVGEVEEIAATATGPMRRARKGIAVPETMPVCRAFAAHDRRVLPYAWAIAEPSDDVLRRLRAHGVTFALLEMPLPVRAQRFAVQQKQKPKRPFQGHHELRLVGHWTHVDDVTLPVGAVLVSSRQPRARVAATLLEPESEDSLSTWNFFEAATGEHFPVLRVVRLP